ncbi:glycosyltransferase family 2 protein [Marinobacterium sedimentorum]|uniref:glycosyltransferase family 2 protein n=1 Tax=Marinobacterium sedimentorum TaxID=2927804 RepID=UPI0020C637CA|nr:glycosyltransferase family 2 protein [Marinobacterium sedimentorum]MCP8686836.1 glycosyltransferase family 2 protein [Marinobacterium sedimentorum]
MTLPKLNIVVPCYNEEEVLPETVKQLGGLLTDLIDKGKVGPQSKLLMVDDGSRDATWEQIAGFAEQYEWVGGIKLSRNRGHQNALLAGLQIADGDAVVSIDADLQDDIRVIETMVDRYHQGYEVIYGVRDDRSTDSFFKRFSAEFYYRVLALMGVEIIFNHADYRLLSRRALDALKAHDEVNLFLRGIVPTLGYKSCQVPYQRSERFAGESKYPLRKMLALAFDGVTSFSAVPLRLIALLGILMFVASIGISIWALWVKFFSDTAVPGWTSSVLPMYFLGGIQLLSLGVVGEYVAKIYMEIKRRPRYFIEEIL